ncbi:MAG TPA: phosphomannomutase/phosphoglucomutase [Candidatus Krumholzibacteria bacterium]|nr:phosphomannomutase/phosphoglucomutase [Candidatus Krumholzibacteria bacterium]
MSVPAHIFREYDVRGVVDTDLRPDFVLALGRALGTAFRRAGATRVGVARDVRPSGVELRDQLVRGLRSTGCDVVDYGAAPTGVFYHAQATGEEQAGVVITGSHNPPEFNGFKLVLHGGSFFGEQIQDLRRLIEAEDYETGEGSSGERDVLGPYVEDVRSKVSIDRPVRFAYDSGNGAASLVAARLFAALGQEPVALFDEPDGTFPNHHPDPTIPEYLKDLRRRVVDDGLEFGMAYDGDADRVGVIDDRGEILWGDRLLVLFARDLLERSPGATVIHDVKCSQTLTDAVNAAGGEAMIWKTGHSLIKQKMKETGAPLAGEMSGHLFLGENWYGFDDALFATVRLLEIVARHDRPLSELLADVPTLHATPEIRVDCPDAVKFEVVDRVREHFRGRAPIVDIDGVRVTFDKGWGLVRASNTQPALVMRVEADDAETLGAYRDRMEDAIAKARAEVGDAGA